MRQKKDEGKSLQVITAKLFQNIAGSIIGHRDPSYVELIFNELDFADTLIFPIDFLEKVEPKGTDLVILIPPREKPNRSLIDSIWDF